MKAKINHIIPLISINGNLETIWKEIRKTILNNVLFKDILPKESGTILGISYFSIIVRPLLKIITKQKQNNINDGYTDFLYESSKKAFIIWNKVEENNTDEIKKLIRDYIEGNRFISLEEWEAIIYKEAIRRLFRNDKIPESIINKEKLKAPNLINLLSNALKHIIEDFKKKIKRKKEENEEVTNIIFKIVMKYLLIENLSFKDIKLIKEPDINDTKSLIEYKQIEDLSTYVLVIEVIDNNTEKANKIIEELIDENKNKKFEEIKITREIEQIINDTRNKIMSVGKKAINLMELALEKAENILNKTNSKKNTKKRGRPKKEAKEDHNQSKIEDYYNNRQIMDLDEN